MCRCLERRRDVGEIGDAAADDENLAVGMRLARHQTQNRFRVFERLRFARRAGVLAVVGQFGTEAQIADSITREKRKNT